MSYSEADPPAVSLEHPILGSLGTLPGRLYHAHQYLNEFENPSPDFGLNDSGLDVSEQRTKHAIYDLCQVWDERNGIAPHGLEAVLSSMALTRHAGLFSVAYSGVADALNELRFSMQEDLTDFNQNIWHGMQHDAPWLYPCYDRLRLIHISQAGTSDYGALLAISTGIALPYHLAVFTQLYESFYVFNAGSQSS